MTRGVGRGADPGCCSASDPGCRPSTRVADPQFRRRWPGCRPAEACRKKGRHALCRPVKKCIFVGVNPLQYPYETQILEHVAAGAGLARLFLRREPSGASPSAPSASRGAAASRPPRSSGTSGTSRSSGAARKTQKAEKAQEAQEGEARQEGASRPRAAGGGPAPLTLHRGPKSCTPGPDAQTFPGPLTPYCVLLPCTGLRCSCIGARCLCVEPCRPALGAGCSPFRLPPPLRARGLRQPPSEPFYNLTRM